MIFFTLGFHCTKMLLQQAFFSEHITAVTHLLYLVETENNTSLVTSGDSWRDKNCLLEAYKGLWLPFLQ